mmetsp:Transcript_85581/g.135752  ORF Transcript_85581/g.135752 Transcript_85581/m.135752 type:complete len:231 (+) Transcript_85581:193-885(+)
MRLKEIEGQGPPARKAKEVDRRNGKGIRIAEHATVVIHLSRCDQQFPRPTEAKQGLRVLHRDQRIAGTMDEEHRARDVRHPPLVLEDVAKQERHQPATDVPCRRSDTDEGRDQDHPTQRILRGQEDRRTAAQRSTEDDHRAVAHPQVIHQISEDRQRNFEDGLLCRLNPLQEAVARVFDGDHIDLELIPHVLHKVKRRSDVLGVGMEIHHYCGRLRCWEPKARHPTAAAW